MFAPIFVFVFINWGQSQPGPRHLEKVAYDTDRNRLVLFGGVELQKEKWIEPSSIHEWDGNNWTASEGSGPIGRRAGALVYNESTKETYLFGGVSTGKVQPDSVLSDAWSWNGRKWRLLHTVCPVKEPEATYDRVNERILVYGDAHNKRVINYDSPAEFELWAYKNGDWTKLSTDGPNITGSGKICFDAARGKLVVPVFNDKKLTVWEWSDRSGWTRTESEKNCPIYRTKFSLAYHMIEKATYLFGGLSAERKELGDLWKWDGRLWTKIDFTGGPSGRNSSQLLFGKNELLLYGGTAPKSPPEIGSKLCNDLWGWRNGVWKQYDNDDIDRTGSSINAGYPVGFKTIRLQSSGNKPMLISLWYPATSKTDLLTRRDVIKSGKIKISDTDSSLVADFKRPLKWIFNVDVNDSLYYQAIGSKTKSFSSPKFKDGRFPLIIATATPASYFDSFEFFASHGFVVAGVTSIYEESPAGPSHYKQFTDLLDELLQYMVKQEYVLSGNIAAFGHGGGIQSAMYLAMRTKQIKKVINLDGGFFGPRSNTTVSSDYHPEKFTIPLLHIVTTAQNSEDDVRQFNAIKSPVIKVTIKSDSVWHHDFTGWGTLAGFVLERRSSFNTIYQVDKIVHDLMLKFLMNEPIKETNNSFVSIKKFNQ